MTAPIKGPAQGRSPGIAPSSTIRNEKKNKQFSQTLRALTGRSAVRLGRAGGAPVPDAASTVARGAAAGDPRFSGTEARGLGEMTTIGGRCIATERTGALRPDVAVDSLLGILAPIVRVPVTPSSSFPIGSPPPSFAELWGRLVRKIAWGGDGRRTTARIEIGSGEWAGATIVVSAAAREVAVDIELPAGVAATEWRTRLAERLRERGLDLAELTVRQ